MHSFIVYLGKSVIVCDIWICYVISVQSPEE